MIWLAGSGLALLAVLGVAAPWWLPAFRRGGGLSRRKANVVAYRSRLAEIDADVAAGYMPSDSAEGARAELGAHLLEDAGAPSVETPVATHSRRGVWVAASALLLAFAGAWYALAGSWRTQALIDLAKSDPAAAHAASMEQMIERLRERIADEPDDADAWMWLGRSYRSLERHTDAATALGRASQLKDGQDPDLLAEEGEALAFAQDRSLAGAPAERFAQALALAPDHPRALFYAGIAAMQAGDNGTAITHWERLLRQDLPDETRAGIEHSLAQLRDKAGVKAPAAGPKAAAAMLKLEVRLAPALAAQVRPDDALFVYAQDAAGPRMPLAVRRFTAADLPLTTTLDDTHSMTPARTLSSASRWRVIARLSRAGSATPQPGDLQGEMLVDRARAGTAVALEIDRRLPDAAP